MSNYEKAVKDVRRLVRSRANAVLSTVSSEMDGWPFGSVAPYVLDHQGHPVLLLSDLAQHTRNIQKDPRMSLLVWEDDQTDIQAAARATVMGRATEIEGTETLRDRYLRYLPQAQPYFAVHDFRFYRLSVERVRFIGGFGDIHWVRGEDYLLAADAYGPGFIEAETGAVIHMNGDHRDALVQYCRAQGVEETEPRLLGIDPEGFDVQARLRRVRVDFDAPVCDASGLREAFIRLSRSLGAGGDNKLPGAPAG